MSEQMWFSSWRASCGHGGLCCSNLGQLLRTCLTCRIWCIEYIILGWNDQTPCIRFQKTAMVQKSNVACPIIFGSWLLASTLFSLPDILPLVWFSSSQLTGRIRCKTPNNLAWGEWIEAYHIASNISHPCDVCGKFSRSRNGLDWDYTKLKIS